MKVRTEYSVALGADSNSFGLRGVAIGGLARANGKNALSIGYNSRALDTGAVALGTNSTANGFRSMAFGASAVSSGNQSIAFGFNTQALHNFSIAIGNVASTTRNNQVVLGNATQSYTLPGLPNNAVQSGTLKLVTTDPNGNLGTTALGSSSHTDALAIGRSSNAGFAQSFAIGFGAVSTGINNISIGNSSATYTLAGLGALVPSGQVWW